MATAAQIAANQRNAQRSTGPRTEEGKAASSQNNFRHGLRCVFKVLPNESQADYDAHLASLVAEHQPATYTEELLVDLMAQHYWHCRRTLASIDRLMEKGCEDPKLLAIFLRYQTQFSRSFHRCLTDLTKLRAQRVREQIGFERQDLQRAAEARRQQTADARNRNLHAQAAAREVATAARFARLTGSANSRKTEITAESSLNLQPAPPSSLPNGTTGAA